MPHSRCSQLLKLLGSTDARSLHGPEVLDTLIVSGTSSVDDVRRAQPWGLNVVPRFETVDDLAVQRESPVLPQSRNVGGRHRLDRKHANVERLARGRL